MSSPAAGALVFLTSAAVLVLEILAGRLLAPFVGVTLETYTGVIGVVLAGISLGSWWGGRLADRLDPRRLLGPLLVAGGALASLTVPVVLFLGAGLYGGGPLAVVILALAGFFPPAVALSAVTPVVVKLRLHDLDQTGHVVGRLSALGTAGAILGTFVTGFVLVAHVPTRATILVLAAALALAGMVLHVRLRPDRAGDDEPGTQMRSYAVVALLGLALTGASRQPCDVESAYYCAQVVADADNASRRTLILDSLTHSTVDIDDPTYLGFHYIRWFADAIDAALPPGQPLRALHVGGGGFTMPRWLEATRPGSDSLVLEIDPTLVELARERLGLETGPQLQVRTGDARMAADELAADRYDVIIGDAFGGLAVPWHLTTIEFTAELRRALAPGGLYLVNVIDGPPFGFARAELATLRALFTHTAVIAPPERLEGRSGGNLVLLASDRPLPMAELRLAARRHGAIVGHGGELDAWMGDARVLTDDHAPVDQLLGFER